MSDHKPLIETELKEMEAMFDANTINWGGCHDGLRLIAEVRQMHAALTIYGTPAHWSWVSDLGAEGWVFTPTHPDYRSEPGHKLARDTLGWGSPDEPCENPSCDGVKDDLTDGTRHRCFKDGRWLDDGSEM